MGDNDVMGIQQPRNLHGNFFAAARRALNTGDFSNISRHGQTHATEELNALSNGINQLNLLGKMLIEEQMKLIKSWSRNLPV